MKKILILVLFNILTINIFCQNESYFSGGFRAGFTASQISGDELSGWNKMGGYAGGFVNFPVSANGKWKLQGEVDFSMKGSSKFLKANKDGTVPDKYVLTLMYIELPFLAKFQPKPWFEVEAGPSVNFLCFQREKDANGVMPARQSFRLCELAIHAGFSFIIKQHFGLNLRWSSSIVPVRVADGEHSAYRIRKKQFNDVITTSLFYQF